MGLFFDDIYPWEDESYPDPYDGIDDDYLGACDDFDFESFEKEFEENYLDPTLAKIVDPERNPHIKKAPKKKPFGIEFRNSPSARRLFNGEEWRVYRWYATEKARDSAWEEIKKRCRSYSQSLCLIISHSIDDYRKCER